MLERQSALNSLTVQFASWRKGDVSPSDLLVEPTENLVIMPYIDRHLAERCARHLAQRAGVLGTLLAIEDIDRQGLVATNNHAYQHTRSRVVAYVAQDAFAGRHWLAIALYAMQKSGKSMLGFNDGKWSGALAAFGLVAREWADRNYQGQLFYPGYDKHYADAELTVLAISDQQYCYDANAVLVEVDWDKDHTPVAASDRQLYRTRVADGFNKRVAHADLLTMFS